MVELMSNEKYLFVVSGPSGTGKDTVVAALRKKHEEIVISISATTREKRQNEQDGVNYYFLTTEDFENKIKNGEMLEYTNYCGNYYGTPKFSVEKCMENKEIVVLVIEVNGAANVKKMYPNSTTVFIKPPSIKELENRLRGRGTEEEETIIKRLNRANKELEIAKEYDFEVINDDIEKCANEIFDIMQKVVLGVHV